jgi:protein TonB
MPGGMPAPVAFALSAAVHAAALAGLARIPAPSPPAAVDVAFEVVEVAPPPPPAPPEPPPSAPAPRRPPRATPLAPPRDAPPPPAPVAEAPPPPNAEPPEEAPAPAKAPVKIGISMSSSTTSDGVAAPAGNTLHGEVPRTAPDPGDVKPYRSEKYVPPTQVTVLPRPIGDCRLPDAEYPDEARRLGLEGLVVLVLTTDEKGAIVEGRVAQDPGHGLGPAALASVRRHCRFEPARKGGDAVSTSFRYKVWFELR